jgi:hypothetical protein
MASDLLITEEALWRGYGIAQLGENNLEVLSAGASVSTLEFSTTTVDIGISPCRVLVQNRSTVASLYLNPGFVPTPSSGTVSPADFALVIPPETTAVLDMAVRYWGVGASWPVPYVMTGITVNEEG